LVFYKMVITRWSNPSSGTGHKKKQGRSGVVQIGPALLSCVQQATT
jgi:hypothetical protein